MQERNVFGGVVATLLSPFADFFGPLRYFFILALVLIAADLWFGIQAAKKRNERIKASRAIRRTLNKVVDYTCWILLAGTLGLAFGEPFDIKILPAIVMCIVVGVEFESCVVNYFESKGKHVRFNWKKLFGKKAETMLDGVIEESKDENAGVKH